MNTSTAPSKVQPTPSLPNSTVETPLSNVKVGLLIASATAVIIGFYLYCLLALVLIGILLLLDIALFIVLLRVGLSSLMSKPIGNQIGLATQLFRSLNLGKEGAPEALPLTREDAPRLWNLVTQVAERVGVPVPDELLLEMNDNAWVRLRGYRKGRGHCTLGVGFDLLAILSQAQLEAVLAHEMAHARLVQRGYSGWLTKGMTRVARLATHLHYTIVIAGQNGSRFYTARVLRSGAYLLGKTGSRLVAAYSRQDEFAADRMGAQMCGADIYRSTLIEIRITSDINTSLDNRTRLIQSQRDESFTEWIRLQRLPNNAEARALKEQKALDDEYRSQFDTHPRLRDRLAALPPETNPAPARDTTAALTLLDDPDALALRLLETIERVSNEQEHAESEQMKRWVRKQSGGSKNTPLQGLALIITGIGVCVSISGIILLLDTTQTMLFRAMLLIVGMGVSWFGIWLNRRFAWKESYTLPMPSLLRWRETFNNSDARGAGIDSWQIAIRDELRAQKPLTLKGRTDSAQYWGKLAYHALGECDYQRAYIASQLCLEERKDDLAGLLSKSIALTYYRVHEAAGQTLGFAVERYGLGPSASSALGWVLLLQGDAASAEPYLLDATTQRPQEHSLWALLGLSQLLQDKFREAAQNVRKAIELQPEDLEYHDLLMRTLLGAGQVKAALRELEWLENHHFEDDTTDFALAKIRTYLLLGRHEIAEQLISALHEQNPKMQDRLQLAFTFTEANLDDRARIIIEEVNTEAFYPEALLELARLDYKREEKEAMRQHLLAALDLSRELAPEADHQLQHLDKILEGLKVFKEPAEKLQAWMMRLDLSQTPLLPALSKLSTSPLKEFSLLVYAHTQEEAKQYVDTILQALYPGADYPINAIKWQASKEHTPDTPEQPGVQDYAFA